VDYLFLLGLYAPYFLSFYPFKNLEVLATLQREMKKTAPRVDTDVTEEWQEPQGF
jgi:hypothetical protein